MTLVLDFVWYVFVSEAVAEPNAILALALLRSLGLGCLSQTVVDGSDEDLQMGWLAVCPQR
jgi:hypothetical protein